MADATPLRLRFDAFEIDEANARLTREGRPIALPPKAFGVLCALARQPGRLVTKNALLDTVWGHQHVSESLLKTVISEVRAALADDARHPRFIETASRYGYRFIGAAAEPSVAPAPNASVSDAEAPFWPMILASAPLVGRVAELAKIREIWARAAAGERQLLFVAGEAGVGKTTLINAFVRGLGPRVAAIGRCIEHFGAGEPYLPVLEVMREICRAEPKLVEMMRTVAPTWLVQMPWLVSEEQRATLHHELAGAHPDRMVREMRELMDRFAVGNPIVFILEDMQWSDRGTLRMMEHFARQPRRTPVLWIATFRLTQIIAEGHPLKDLRQELRLHHLCEEILLDPFSETEVETYLGDRMPHMRASEQFVRRLHAHTDGLPLFVASVADALAEQALQETGVARQWVDSLSDAPLPVPESLAGVIEKQMGRLAPNVQAVLQAASMWGAEFRASAVAEILERDVASVREQCDDLVRQQLWLREAGVIDLPDGELDVRYAFTHAIYQHVCYDRVPLSQRVQHHRRIARALERARAAGETLAPAEIASHYERGREPLAAMRTYGEAASLALAHFAPKDAASLAAHGLALIERCPESTERHELELTLAANAGVAATQLRGVASREARVAFERAQALADALPQTPQRAATLNGLGWIHYVRGEFDAALKLAGRLREIAARAEDATLFVFACNLSGVSLLGQGRLTAGCTDLERGIDACSRLDPGLNANFVIDPEVSMRLNVAFPLIERGLPDRGRMHFKLGAERARRLGQPMALMLASWAGGLLEVRLGDFAAVGQHAATLAQLVERAVIRQGEGPALWLRGIAEAHAGEPRTGYRRIMEGYQRHADLGMYAGCTEALSYAAEALILDRDWLGAQQRIDEALALAQRIDERLAIPSLMLLQARVAQAAGDAAAARAAMLESMRESQRQEALGLELKALVALAEGGDRTAEDLAALAAVHGRIAEGHDLPIYQRASKILNPS